MIIHVCGLGGGGIEHVLKYSSVFPCYVMSKVDHLVVFLSPNYGKIATS